MNIFRRLLPTICQIFESRYAFIAQYPSNHEPLVAYFYDNQQGNYRKEEWSCDGTLEYILEYTEQDPFNDSDETRIGDTLWGLGIRNLLADRISLPPDLFILGAGEENSQPSDTIRADKYDSYHELTLQNIIELIAMGMRSTANLLQESGLKLARQSNSRGAIRDATLKLLLSRYQLVELVRPEEMVVKKEYDRDMADYINTTISVFKHPPMEGGSRNLSNLSEMFPAPIENIVKLSRERDLEIKVADECILTRLALARTYLWIANDEKDVVPSFVPTGCSGGDDYSKAFQNLAVKELSNVSAGDVIIQHSSLRTLWLWMYLKSDRELATPSVHIETTIKDINAIYEKIKEPTIRALWTGFAEYTDSKTGFPKIDSEWLCLWFGTQLLADAKINEFHRDIKNGAMEILRYFRCLGIYMLHQIHCLRYPDIDKRISFTDVKGSPDSVTIEAKTFLISQFAHISAGVDREIRLHSHLQELFSPELLLYATSESYRDHLFHVIDVCLLGYLLLKCNEQSHWLICFPNDLEKKQSERNWFIASLLHDIGYRLKLSEKLTEILEPLRAPELEKYKKALTEGLSNANKDFDSCIDEKRRIMIQ